MMKPSDIYIDSDHDAQRAGAYVETPADVDRGVVFVARLVVTAVVVLAGLAVGAAAWLAGL